MYLLNWRNSRRNFPPAGVVSADSVPTIELERVRPARKVPARTREAHETRGLLRLGVALVMVAGLWLATLATYRAPVPKSVAGPGDFSAVRATSNLRELVGDSIPHSVGSLQAGVVRERIMHQLLALGYEPEEQSGALVCNPFGTCAMPHNIVVRIPGTDERDGESGGRDAQPGASNPRSSTAARPAADRVLLVAHYDSVQAGPGASDDGVGVATVLEIGRVLKETPRLRHTVILLFDEGEEAGLLGAELFAQKHPWASRVKAVVNLDARGTSGPSMMFETGSATRWSMQTYAAAIPRPLTNSVCYTLYSRMPNSTEFTVFKRSGAQGFNFAFIDSPNESHTALDDVKHVDLASVQQQGEQALAVLRTLASADLEHIPVDKAEFFDVFGAVLVRIPQYSLLPAAGCTLVLILAAAIVTWRRGNVTARALAWSQAATPAAMLISVAASVLLSMAVRSGAPEGIPQFFAQGWVVTIASAGVGGIVLGILGAGLAGRATFWSTFIAHGAWTALAATGLASWLPGTSYLFLLPAVTVLLLIGLRLLGRLQGSSGPTVACCVYLAVMFTLLWPILLFLYKGIGTPALPLVTLLAVFGGVPIIGLLHHLSVGDRRGFLATAVVVLVLGVTLTVVTPAYSVESPQRLNVTYQVDRATLPAGDRARWLLQTNADRMPKTFATAANFEPLSVPLFPWSNPNNPRTFVANAPLLDLSAPKVSILSARTGSGGLPARPGNRYVVQIVLPDAVSTLTVGFPPASRVTSVSVAVPGADGQTPVEVPFERDPNEWRLLRFVGLPSRQITLDFEAGSEEFPLELVSTSSGLPDIGSRLLRARPPDTAATQEGDTTVVASSIRLSTGTEPRAGGS